MYNNTDVSVHDPGTDSSKTNTPQSSYLVSVENRENPYAA